MLASNKFITACSLITMLLLVGLASPAYAETTIPHSPHVADRLEDLRRTAIEMRNEADALKVATPQKRLSWQSHTYRLDALKDLVNEMGKSLTELEAQAPLANEKQALAIEHTRIHLVPVAQNLTEAIQLINENRNNVHWGEYREAVSDIYTHTEALHTKLDTILDYENARMRFDRLEM